MLSKVAAVAKRLLPGSAPAVQQSQWVTAKVVGDPLRTLRLRQRADTLITARLQRVRRMARATVESLGGTFYGQIHGAAIGPTQLSPSPEQAGIQFAEWWIRAMMGVLLDSEPEQTRPREGELHWTRQLTVQTVTTAAVQAYQRMKDSVGVSEELDSFLSRQRSTNAVDIIGNRQYSFLRDMTLDTSRVLRDEIQRGMREGRAVQDIADSVVARAEKITVARARTIIRSEITYAHAEASLNSYQALGARTVELQVEWTLGVHGSGRPCARCKARAGMVLSINDARGLLPLHPNCQCGWVPVGSKDVKTGRKYTEDYRRELAKVQEQIDEKRRGADALYDRYSEKQQEFWRIQDRLVERGGISNEEITRLEKEMAKLKADWWKRSRKLSAEARALKVEALRAAGILEKGHAKAVPLEYGVVFQSPGLNGRKRKKAEDPSKKGQAVFEQGRKEFQQLMGRELPGSPPVWPRRMSGERRAFHRPLTRNGEPLASMVLVTPSMDASTVRHELGHWLESADENALRNSVDFLRRRAGDDKLIDPGKSFPEPRLPDKFIDDYTGKVYVMPGSAEITAGRKFKGWEHIRASEVTSMGAQYLLDDPAGFLDKDPDHFAVTIANLKGVPVE